VSPLSRAPRAGVTLVELLVVIALLGLAAGIAGLAFGRLDASDPDAERAAQIAAARREALETRRMVRLTLETEDGPAELTVYPDGSARGDAALDVDPLTGRPRVTR
jgi:prepilin-type N-terminal cleavage/methylation domain-containing protein